SLAVANGGLGYLIFKAQSSTEFGKLYLRAAISQTVTGGYIEFEGNIEDRLSHLFRGLDSICEAFKLKKGTPIAQYLHEETASIAAKIVDEAANKLMSLNTVNEDESIGLKRLA